MRTCASKILVWTLLLIKSRDSICESGQQVATQAQIEKVVNQFESASPVANILQLDPPAQGASGVAPSAFLGIT